jgi:hypothetical protein
MNVRCFKLHAAEWPFHHTENSRRVENKKALMPGNEPLDWQYSCKLLIIIILADIFNWLYQGDFVPCGRGNENINS